MQTVSKVEFEELLNVLLKFWDIQSKEYYNIYVKNVIFLYKVLSENTAVKKKNPHIKIKQEEKIIFKFHGYSYMLKYARICCM